MSILFSVWEKRLFTYRALFEYQGKYSKCLPINWSSNKCVNLKCKITHFCRFYFFYGPKTFWCLLFTGSTRFSRIMLLSKADLLIYFNKVDFVKAFFSLTIHLSYFSENCVREISANESPQSVWSTLLNVNWFIPTCLVSLAKCPYGHKSHDPCYHNKYIEAGVTTFVAHCTQKGWYGFRTPLAVAHEAAVHIIWCIHEAESSV